MKNELGWTSVCVVAGVIVGYVMRYQIDVILFNTFGMHNSSFPMP